jgi:hypothetical protein
MRVAASPSPKIALPGFLAVLPCIAGVFALLGIHGAANAGQDAHDILQNVKDYKQVSSHGSWTLFMKKNSLDIWRGNVPYEKMKNGHASFVVAWSAPLTLPLRDGPAKVQSAAISYVFSCSQPLASLFVKVVFFATPFIPKNDTVMQQWSYARQVVVTYPGDEKPDAVSWGRTFDWESMQHWRKAWEKIYKEACAQ